MKKKLNTGFFDEQPDEQQQEAANERKGSSKGLADGLTRYTMIVEASKLETLKALAYEDRLSMKELADDMLNKYIDQAGAAKVKKALKDYNNKKK